MPLVQGSPGSTANAGGLFELDTRASAATRHGYALQSPLVLDTQAGFTLQFSLQVLADSSASPNRAGFSLLVVGSDPQQALELGFGSAEVFAQDHQPSDPDRFVRGSVAAVAPGQAHQYTLTVAQQQYTLQSGGQPLLAGSLVDYSAEGLPYNLPNFVFFGDNTSRAAAQVWVGDISLASPVPEPASLALWLAGLGLLGAWRRAVKAA